MHLDHLLVRRTELAEDFLASPYFEIKPAERYRTFVAEFPVIRRFFGVVRESSGNRVTRYVWLALWIAMEEEHATGCDKPIIAALAELDELPWFVFEHPKQDRDPAIYWLEVLNDAVAQPRERCEDG